MAKFYSYESVAHSDGWQHNVWKGYDDGNDELLCQCKTAKEAKDMVEELNENRKPMALN